MFSAPQTIPKILIFLFKGTSLAQILHTVAFRTRPLRLRAGDVAERRLVAAHTQFTRRITVVTNLLLFGANALVYALPFVISCFARGQWLVPYEVHMPGLRTHAHPGYELHMLVLMFASFYLSGVMWITNMLFFHCASYVALQFDVIAVRLGRIGGEGGGDGSQMLRLIVGQMVHLTE